MATIKSKKLEQIPDSKIHKGYNEKNPTQSQGAFVADSNEITGKEANDASEPIGKNKGIEKK